MNITVCTSESSQILGGRWIYNWEQIIW